MADIQNSIEKYIIIMYIIYQGEDILSLSFCNFGLNALWSMKQLISLYNLSYIYANWLK
jgi:hypothetical protein